MSLTQSLAKKPIVWLPPEFPESHSYFNEYFAFFIFIHRCSSHSQANSSRRQHCSELVSTYTQDPKSKPDFESTGRLICSDL